MTRQGLLGRLSVRLETAALRGAMALPTPLQRRLAGRPIEIEGQRLATETQLLLRLQRLAPDPPVESVPIPQGRTLLLKQTAAVGGRQDVGTVRRMRAEVRDEDGERAIPVRLYTPNSLLGARDPSPLLVFFHGGGWIYGDLDSHDAVCRFLAEQADIRVLAVDYRLAPEHPFPAAYRDCLAVYRWALDHLDELSADPERLAVGGDSAGGCLAATTAIEAARQGWPLRFQLLVYPATDMTGSRPSRVTFGRDLYLTTDFMDLAKRSYLTRPGDETDPRASPLFAELPPGLAPAFVATAGFDPLRDEGEEYAGRLAEAGCTVDLERFPDQIHGFFNVVGVGTSSRAAVDRIADRLRDGLA